MIPFLILLFTITSCNKDSDKEPIDSKILISAHKNEGSVVMKCKTEKVYPCLGYEIVYKKNVSNTSLNTNQEFFTSFKPTTSKPNYQSYTQSNLFDYSNDNLLDYTIDTNKSPTDYLSFGAIDNFQDNFANTTPEVNPCSSPKCVNLPLLFILMIP